jgi:signal transduction histidine kinase
MRQPIHVLGMLNLCLHDAMTAHEEREGGVSSPELMHCVADSRQMRDVLKHLMSLADDFLVFSSLNSSAKFSLKLVRATLSTICEQVELVIGTLAIEKGITFSLSPSELLNKLLVNPTSTFSTL